MKYMPFQYHGNYFVIYIMNNIKYVCLTLLLAIGISATAQGILGGHVTGNVQLDGQVSHRDSIIGASDVPENLLMNTRADIIYTNGNFSAGLRFEAYQNPMLGFNPQYKGQGIANYFVSYQGDKLSVTAGNFYEQFGNGMILRTYEDRYLGLDNSLLGFNVKYRPVSGITLKGIIGKQRYYWEHGDGLVRGLDGEVNLNEVVRTWNEAKTRVTLGVGFVSKYEPDATILSEDPNYKLNLPLNVGATALRGELTRGNWNFMAEYAYKGQDPNVMNGYIYKPGNAIFLNGTYAQRGFSANLQLKRVDNMAYKSVRSQTGEMLYINYIPSITKQYTYAFLNMYPYATQATGELGLQGDIMYTLKKGTALGGKYGTELHLNYSVINGLDSTNVGGAGTDGYTTAFIGNGDLYYSDFNFEIQKKIDMSNKLVLIYGYMVFNPVVEGHAGHIHHNHIVVAEWTHKFAKQRVLRLEGEWMGSDSKYTAKVDDKRCGDWIMGQAEYNFNSNWFINVSDQYAYNDGTGNYYSINMGYAHGASRFVLGYGKQREGIICVGGVCRPVPASNGLTFSLTTSF